MFDLFCIGDSTNDTFVQIDEASLLCDVKPHQCLLCLSWADKIPSKKVTHIPGVGNSANACVGASRLGLKTAIYTHIGDDIIGQSILQVFKNEGIDTSFVKVEKGRQSNYSVVLNYKSERSIIVRHEEWKYNLPKDFKAKWIYYSSVGPKHKKLNSQVLKKVQKDNIKLVFQPGTFQLRENHKSIHKILKYTHILLLNKEEAARVLKEEDNAPGKQASQQTIQKWVKYLCYKLSCCGPKYVVVTDGPDGAYAYDGKDIFFVEIFPIKAKERTGAGDSFSIGFVSALIKGKSIEQALLWANANASSVVQYIGAQKGLLNENQIVKMIKKFKSIYPRKI